MVQQRIILSFGEDEYLPILITIGHNLKEENMYMADIEMILNMPNYYIFSKKFLYKDLKVNIFLTHSDQDFIRGFLYYNNKEIPVLDHRTYASLQLGQYAYDNISVLKLPENPFLEK